MLFVMWKHCIRDGYWYVVLRLHMCPPAKSIKWIRFRVTDTSGNEAGWIGIITDRSLIKLVRIAFPHRLCCRSLTCLCLSLSQRAAELKRRQTQDAAPLVWKLTRSLPHLREPTHFIWQPACMHVSECACVWADVKLWQQHFSVCVCAHVCLFPTVPRAH